MFMRICNVIQCLYVRTYVCVCMYVCMYVIYICVWVSVLCVYMCVCVCVCVEIPMQILAIAICNCGFQGQTFPLSTLINYRYSRMLQNERIFIQRSTLKIESEVLVEA